MHLERLQDVPHTHKQTPQKSDPAMEYEGKELPTKPGSSGSGTQGPPGQSFHASNQAVGLNSNTDPGGSFTKCQKQKGLPQEPTRNDGEGTCDGAQYSRMAVVGKRGSNSSESDDSAETDDKQRGTVEGVNGPQGGKGPDNYMEFSLGSKEDKPRVTETGWVPWKKGRGTFVVDHHAMTGSVSLVNMVVGYGGESLALRVMEKTPSASVASSPPMNSPRQSSAGNQLQTLQICCRQNDKHFGHEFIITLPVELFRYCMSEQLLRAVLPESDLHLSGSGPAHISVDQQWLQPSLRDPMGMALQCTASPSTSSVATTPVPIPEVVSSAFLKPGVLIVNVRWRNKSYSGSLIDIGQHEWAPPRLSSGFSESVQFKDLYLKQDAEGPLVDIDVEEEEGKENDACDVPMEVSSRNAKEGGVEASLLLDVWP
eukprot:Em0009g938a